MEAALPSRLVLSLQEHCSSIVQIYSPEGKTRSHLARDFQQSREKRFLRCGENLRAAQGKSRPQGRLADEDVPVFRCHSEATKTSMRN